MVWRPASWKKPCLGLQFHGDILSEDKRKWFLFSLIVVNLLSSSILQAEQQKVTGFFPTFLCYSCNVLFTGYMQVVDSLCSFHDQFWSLVSLFFWQFRIHYMSALLIAFRVTYNWYVLLLWEQDGFVFLAFCPSDIISSASCVKW